MVPVALNGETSDIGGHTHSSKNTHTHIFMPKLMRQIYDGCWPQQIKLTVMYVGGRVSRCTNRPHTHFHTHTSGGPLLPVLLVRLPCQAAPLQHACIMKFLGLICVFFFFPFLHPQTHPAASKLPLKDSFTFDDYRSVCVVNVNGAKPLFRFLSDHFLL